MQSTTVIAQQYFCIQTRKESSIVEASCGKAAWRPMNPSTGIGGASEPPTASKAG